MAAAVAVSVSVSVSSAKCRVSVVGGNWKSGQRQRSSFVDVANQKPLSVVEKLLEKKGTASC